MTMFNPTVSLGLVEPTFHHHKVFLSKREQIGLYPLVAMGMLQYSSLIKVQPNTCMILLFEANNRLEFTLSMKRPSLLMDNIRLF